MRLQIVYEGRRYWIDCRQDEKVSTLKKMVRIMFEIPEKFSHDLKILVLSYKKGEIEDDWHLDDIGIQCGDMIHVGYREEVIPILLVESEYSGEVLEISDKVEVAFMMVEDLRTSVGMKAGLPVSAFVIETLQGTKMYDGYKLGDYGLKEGDRIRLMTWDGWNDFLNMCALGLSSGIVKGLSDNEVIAKYQLKVALYIGAHHGHIDLASTLVKRGVRPEEPIGEHPYKQWCPEKWHPMCYRTPMHEATECGQMDIIRMFVNNSSLCLFVTDGYRRTPLQLALMKKLFSIGTFISTKQSTKVFAGSTDTISLRIFCKLQEIADQSREKCLLRTRGKTTLKRRLFNPMIHVGNGVVIDGYQSSFTKSCNTSIDKVDRNIMKSSILDNYGTLPEICVRRFFEDSKMEYGKRFQKDVGITLHKIYNLGSLTASRRSNKKRLISGLKSKSDLLAAVDSLGGLPTMEDLDENSIDDAGRKTSVRLNSINATNRTQESVKGQNNALKKEDETSNKDNQSKSKVSIKIAIQKAKAKSSDDNVALPEHSQDLHPRPLFYSVGGSASKNIIKSTLEAYRKNYRGVKGRSLAIQHLCAAQGFKDRTWLEQIKIANTMAAKRVSRSLIDVTDY